MIKIIKNDCNHDHDYDFKINLFFQFFSVLLLFFSSISFHNPVDYFRVLLPHIFFQLVEVGEKRRSEACLGFN